MAITPEQRARVRAFLLHLAAQHNQGWDGLMVDAGVPSSTAREWRYGKRGLPNAVHMINLLQASGLISHDDYGGE